MPVQAIGIDLGTTRSVVATIEKGKPRVIPNAEGQLVTPSVVAFTREGGVLVGQMARRQAAANPERTVASIKRYMGSDRRVHIGSREYTPQEISAFILRKLKEDAEAFLGERVERAVVSVPAYFSDPQREATKEAAALAGIEVLRLINEPTAAALAYGLNREEAHTVLVWDLGGGTFDISILELGEGIFEVRVVSGDTWLGGDDFDQLVMKYLAEEYRRSWGDDFPKDPGAWERLREAAEKAKVQLSSSPQIPIRIPFVVASPGPRHLDTTLTREKLEDLVAPLLQRLVPPVHQALADAGLTPQQIDRVILVGNGTKMPAVRQLAIKLLAQEPYRYIDPDLVTGVGAAIEAGMLLGLLDKAVLLDVLPLSLGVETKAGLFAKIIRRNTPLPASEAQVFSTAADYQTAMDIHILQGERELAADNISLGPLQLNGLRMALKGVPKVEVEFEADTDGIVHVTARDLLTDNVVTTTVASSKRLDPQEIERLTQEAKEQAEQDKGKRERVRAGIEADNLITAAEKDLEELDNPQTNPQVESLVKAMSQVQEALASGVTANIKARSGELLKLLEASHSGRSRDARPIAHG